MRFLSQAIFRCTVHPICIAGGDPETAITITDVQPTSEFNAATIIDFGVVNKPTGTLPRAPCAMGVWANLRIGRD